MKPADDTPEVGRSVTGLLREALRYLKDYGPLNRNSLYVRFNEDNSGDIGSALQILEELKYIEIGSDNTVKITAWGMAQL